MKKLKSVLCMPLLILPSACSFNNGGLKVAATFAPIYDFAKRIIGDKVELICVVGENEPHEFSPNNARISAFCEKADVVFTFGHEIDSWAGRLSNRCYEVSQNVEFIENDPHAWLSIKESIKMLESIKDYMISIDKENESYYLSNFLNAKNEFLDLYTNYDCDLRPENIRINKFVTSHAAFSYIARDFELEQKAISGVTNQEPTANQLIEVINYIKENDIHYILVEGLDELGHADAVADELKKQDYLVEYLEVSAFETINVNDFENSNYIKVMENNLEAYKKCLK